MRFTKTAALAAAVSAMGLAVSGCVTDPDTGN